jgi:hypothetical protein
VGTARARTPSDPEGSSVAEPPKASRICQLPTELRRRVKPNRPVLLVLATPIRFHPPRAE